MASKKRSTSSSRSRAKLHVAATNTTSDEAEKTETSQASDEAEQTQSPAASVAAAMGAAAVLHRAEAEDQSEGNESDADDDTIAEMFKRRDLIQAVSERADLKKSDVREFVDLVLDEMSKALTEGKELILPPIGKITIKRRTAQTNGDMLVAKIKLKTREEAGADSSEDALADQD